MLKRKKSRLLPALLAAAMALSLFQPLAPTAKAADSTVTGSISGTLRIDYEQPLSELKSREVQVELLNSQKAALGTIKLAEPGGQPLGSYTAEVTHHGPGGDAGGEWPEYLDFSVDGLPEGNYTLRFSGKGYASYDQPVEMTEYARHIILGTGGKTFALGDFDGDGRVDSRDREMLSQALGSGAEDDLERYDLNGDGKIDIVDLAYVNWQVGAQGGAELLNTTLLKPPVDTDETEKEMARTGTAVVFGKVEDLFRKNDSKVTLSPGADGTIVIPITFTSEPEMEQIRISHEYITDGTVEVLTADNETYYFDIDSVNSDSAQLLSASGGENDGKNVITVNLGRRVPVKKITITVTKTPKGYAVVENIEFLKEMVPLDPGAAGSQVKGLKAEAGDGKVALMWNRVPNITGYRVDWHPVDVPAKGKSVWVDVNSANITGLENQTEYEFTVTAVDGNWSGKPSEPVRATPQPASAPSAPDRITVAALDAALRVSWQKVKGAAYYDVYYKPKDSAGGYTHFNSEPLDSAGVTINGLENGTTYSLYVTAGNDIGVSKPSSTYEGTPKAVVYERPAGIPTRGVLDHNDFESVRLAQPGNYNASMYPGGFDPQYMADGDYRTHWTVNNWSSNEHVIVTFKEPQDLLAAIWVPRLDGTYAQNLARYSVLVWYNGEDLNAPGHHVTGGPKDENSGSTADPALTDGWPAVRNNPASTKFGVLPFGPQRKVKQVSVAVEQRAYTAVSLSEIMFLTYDEAYRLPEDIGALFADELRTKLAGGVTQERINELKARLDSDEQKYYMDINTLRDELALADEILNGKTGSSVVVGGFRSRNASNDSKDYGQDGSVLQPLGVAAGAGQEITIYAEGIPENGTVKIIATQFNAEVSAWQKEAGTLKNGRNILTIPKIGDKATPRGGSLYLTYSGASPETIRLHIRRGTGIPVLEASNWNGLTDAEKKTAASAYITDLDNYLKTYNVKNSTTDWRNVTEISTPSVLLSLAAGPVQAGLNQTDRAAQLVGAVDAWEELLSICRRVQGIGGTMESRQNIRCMTMFTGAFMYAAGSHIGIGYGSCAGMAGGRPLSQLGGASSNSLYGWGIAHEIGHNMDRLGKAEITNNIYSLAVQTSDGARNTLRSRLEKSGKYAAIFNKTAQARPGASGDVFVQLGLYWQLHLAYDEGDVDAPLKFYNDFFTAWKAGTYAKGASSYDDKVALTAAGVVHRDLTEFFTRWGMVLSDETKRTLAGYEPEERAIWYLNDQSRRDRLNGVSAVSGTVSAEVKKSGDKSFTLTFSADVPPERVQGYEISRNGESIAFTTETTYTDTIGSGNNRTYTYTVTAYDTLGGVIGTAKAEQQRVSYDLLVDKDAYSVERKADGTVCFTMKAITDVAGLRLPLGDLGEGDFTVTVTDESGKDIVVRTGSFAGGNQAPVPETGSGEPLEPDRFISYFQKAGEAKDDARVVVYHAKAVTVKGIPEGISLDDVKLVSYMGDDIAFLSGATVGRLAEDYEYDGVGDKKQVIEAGTLVIVGTFQGDPVYNTIRIKGEFAPPDMDSEPTDGPAAESAARYLDGYALLFAEEQEDGIYAGIANGLFIFVPNEQAEKKLQDLDTSCGGKNILPSRICAELWRTDTPEDTEGKRMTSQTLWINSPGGNDLPVVVLKGGSAQ